MQALEHELDRGGHRGGRLVAAGERQHGGSQGRHLLDQPRLVDRGDVLAGVGDDALLERGDDVAHLIGRDPLLVHGEHRALDEVLEDHTVAALLERLDLDLAAGRRGERLEVADPRHDDVLAGAQAAPQRVGAEHLEVADRQADADAAALVDLVAGPSHLAERGDDLLQVVGHADLHVADRRGRAPLGA